MERKSRRKSGILPISAALDRPGMFLATKVLTGFGEAVQRFDDLGTGVRLTDMIEPRGEAPRIEIEYVHARANPAATDEFDAALAEARARGAKRAAEILTAPETLSADGFAEMIACRAIRAASSASGTKSTALAPRLVLAQGRDDLLFPKTCCVSSVRPSLRPDSNSPLRKISVTDHQWQIN
jgi:hypothetical protein